MLQKVGGATEGEWCYRRWVVTQKSAGNTDGGW